MWTQGCIGREPAQPLGPRPRKIGAARPTPANLVPRSPRSACPISLLSDHGPAARHVEEPLAICCHVHPNFCQPLSGKVVVAERNEPTLGSHVLAATCYPRLMSGSGIGCFALPRFDTVLGE